MQWSLFLLFVVGHSFITCRLYEYHYITETKSWTEAQKYCRKHHTDLATISNMTDMERLSKSATYPEEGSSAWIGLYQLNCWNWSRPGVEFNESETNWGKNQPANLNKDQICGIIWPTVEWAVTHCDEKRYFICCDERNTSQKFSAIKEHKNWSEAQSYCRKNHTDLASGPQQLKDKQLRELMKELNDTYKCKTIEDNYKKCNPFIGLRRDTGLVCDVEWKWSDGSSFSFRRWKESVQEKKISQNCATTMLKEDDNKWDTGDCGAKKPFFCHDDNVILVKEEMTWEDALYYCQEHHHDLVSITDLNEQRWIQEKVKNATTEYVWMGLRYTCTLDFWFWVSDEVVSYENWDSGQTMNDCDMSGAMRTGGGHKWFKRNDMEKFNFLCSEE